MEKINVRIKKTNDKAILPKIATEFSAGADLYACLENKNLVIKRGNGIRPHGAICTNSRRIRGTCIRP